MFQLIDLDVDIYTNIQNAASLIKIMSICNKQHLGNIWGSINSKGKTEGELEKGVAYRRGFSIITPVVIICFVKLYDTNLFHCAWARSGSTWITQAEFGIVGIAISCRIYFWVATGWGTWGKFFMAHFLVPPVLNSWPQISTQRVYV